jgi:glycosyltransferase involved in cell wall biosynthesis
MMTAPHSDGNCLVCLWACSWRGLRQRHQQIMARLARSMPVLYVESPRDLWSLLRSVFRGQMQLRQMFWSCEVETGVHAFSPVVPFSLRRYPRLNRLYLRWLAARIRALMRRLGFVKPVLWVSYPLAEPLVGELGEKFACYDCCDELTDLPPKMARIILDGEERLLHKVRMVFVTSEPLLQSLGVRHHSVHLIPNAADVAHFAKTRSENLPRPADLAALKKPLIGFTGSVQHWVDVELIAAGARRRPDWNWVIIGGIHKDIACFQGLLNIHLLGTKPYADLPAYLRQLDVGLVPFEMKPIVFAADPIKVYEYLAAGKPVVSTAIPRLKVFGDVVRIATGPEEFVAQIERALADSSDEAARRRMAVARGHSWESRVEQIVAIWNAPDMASTKPE